MYVERPVRSGHMRRTQLTAHTVWHVQGSMRRALLQASHRQKASERPLRSKAHSAFSALSASPPPARSCACADAAAPRFRRAASSSWACTRTRLTWDT